MLTTYTLPPLLLPKGYVQRYTWPRMSKRSVQQIAFHIARNDRLSQTNQDWEGVRKRADLAALVLASPASSMHIPNRTWIGLALAVHHGGSLHSLRRVLNSNWPNCASSSNILLRRQMTDRVRIMGGRRQIFGTQYKVSKATGKLTRFPCVSD